MLLSELPKMVYAAILTLDLSEIGVSTVHAVELDPSTVTSLSGDFVVPSYRGKHMGIYRREVAREPIIRHEAARYGFGTFRLSGSEILCIHPDRETVDSWVSAVSYRLDSLTSVITGDSAKPISSLEWA